jgi:hypothetical protein
MRILDYALALDGGTQIVVLEIGDGEQVTIGLDGRMGSPTNGKQLFIGASPERSDTRMLPIGGIKEREVISLLEKWVDETQGFMRREALMEMDQSTLEGQDLLDRLALEFFLEVRSRDVA